MLIFLKAVCCIIWLIIMRALIKGGKKARSKNYVEVPLYIDNEDELEAFNEDIHDLLIVRDKNTQSWKFIYLRKEDREKFIEILKSDD